MDELFHIALAADWERALDEGSYRVSTLGRSLAAEGFIHLSFAHQVKTVADAAYRGRNDLVLLELDPDRLHSPVKVEAVADRPERFPHLYGPISPDAVTAVHPLTPRPDGCFEPVGGRSGGGGAD